MIKVRNFLNELKVYKSKNLIKNPLVSVIMPTYCRGDNGILERSIVSVLSQTFANFEFIIIDDGSIDKSESIIKKYVDLDDRIVYIRNSMNSGLPALRVNQGIEISRGKYISYQFDDDQWEKNALEILVKEISEKKDLCLVYGNWSVLDLKSGIRYYKRDEYDYAKLIEGNYIANNSVIHHREIVDIYGMYDMHLVMRRLCDWDLWLRWGKYIPFYHVDYSISSIEMMSIGSLGETCEYDLISSRFYMMLERNEILTLKNYKDFEIDNINFLTSRNDTQNIYNKHILPWKLKKRGIVASNENLYISGDKKYRIIATKHWYDSTINIMLENYLKVNKEHYSFMYIPETQLDIRYLRNEDILILCRATCVSTIKLIKEIKESSLCIPVIYMLDDDLLNIYKLGEEFSYISPDSEMYNIVKSLIMSSDSIITFSESIKATIEDLNDKILVLNTNIPEKYLVNNNFYKENEKFEIVFAGGTARTKEFEKLEFDLLDFLEINEKKVNMTFWGYIPEKIKNRNLENVKYIPYTTSYYQYIEHLSKKNYNLMLVPLDDNEYKRGKSPIKFLESISCGALGLFSDTPVYKLVEDEINGFKINKNEKLSDKINQIIKLPIEKKKEIYLNSRDYVMKNYTTESQYSNFYLATKIGILSNNLKEKVILYVCHSGYLGGAENHLLRHSLLSHTEGFKVLFAIPEEFKDKNFEVQQRIEKTGITIIYIPFKNVCEIESIDKNESFYLATLLESKLKEYEIGLVHSSTIVPSIAYYCKKNNIPYLASLYGTESDIVMEKSLEEFSPDIIHTDSVYYAVKWQEKIGVPTVCIRSFIPHEFFNIRTPIQKNEYHISICGSVQERKGQLKLIEALSRLKDKYDWVLHIFGYDNFYPAYKEECIKKAKEYGVESQVIWEGLVNNLNEKLHQIDMDILVCASDFESFPQVILEAMASEIPVVSTPVAGVPELIIDNKTGYLTDGYSVESIKEGIERCIKAIESGEIISIKSNAKRILIEESSELFVKTQLFNLYIYAFQLIYPQKQKNMLNKLQDGTMPIILDFHKEREIKNNLRFSKLIHKEKRYFISCKNDSFEKIGFLFGSFGKVVGQVELRILKDKILIRQSFLKLENLRFDKWTYFHFDKIENTYGINFELNLLFSYEKNSNKVGIFENYDNINNVHKIYSRLNGDLGKFGIHYLDII